MCQAFPFVPEQSHVLNWQNRDVDVDLIRNLKEIYMHGI